MNAGHATDPALDAVPDRVALVVGDQTCTYRELEEATRRMGAALASAGVGPGDRVALVNLGSVLSVATLFACARLGAASAQMNAYLTGGELAQLVELVGASVGVAGDAYLDQVVAAVPGPVLGEADLGPSGPVDPVGPSGPGDPAVAPPTVGDPDDPALLLFTSGTTGLPKPVAISHRVVADRLAYYGKPIDPGADQVVDMMSAPIFHIGGTLGLLVSLHQGKKLVVLPKFDAGLWLGQVERHRVAQTFVVPVMLRRILDHPDFDSADLSSLRSLSYGAAATPVDLVRRALDALPGVDFSNTFGQTETLGAYAALTPDDHRRGDRFGSVGRPLAGVEVRVVDPATGAEVEAGGTGEFWVRAAQNTTDEWLRTGDTGWRDDDGYLFLAGRISDTINRGGEKFGPVEVEDVLRTHPLVVDVGVVGVPDEELGERVGAVVVCSSAVAPADLVAHCASHLSTYKVPEFVAFADELPTSVLGKVDRTGLRDRLAGTAPVPRRGR